MGQVIVLGSINQDVVVTCERAPRIGETVHGKDLSMYPGGKGANQAVASARFGAATSFIGCVGDDDAGTSMINNFHKNNVDTSHIRIIESKRTGTAHITVDSTGDNSIVVIAGTNSCFNHTEIEALSQLGAPSDILVCQLEIPRDITAEALKTARGRGLDTLLNAAPADNVRDLLPFTTYLVVNESEVRANLDNDSVPLEEGVINLAREFDLTVVVTLGSRGGFVASPTTQFTFDSHSVSVADTTGAGDTFVGSFAASLAAGLSLREAIAYASAAGALSVTKDGAQGGMPSLDDVTAFLESNN